MKKLQHSIVIATRNRPAALRLSVPRMLNQSRPPAELIIVDASDDHNQIREAVRESTAGYPVKLTLVHSAPSAAAQRNLGLRQVTSPIVFFPDDDSIWFEGTAEAQMRIYERDVKQQISAVCGVESAVPPEDWEIQKAGTYKMRFSHRVNQRLARSRARLQDQIFPDPAKALGKQYISNAKELPSWIDEEGITLVEYMTGFRMSFRTSVIYTKGFDETLKRYSLNEDIDASFEAWQHGFVVGAPKASVYHYRSPEQRAHPEMMGVIQVLNKAYVILKRTQPGDEIRKILKRFLIAKVMITKFLELSPSGRLKSQGLDAAMSSLEELLSSKPEEAKQLYNTALEKALNSLNKLRKY